jgi:pimeloyl-ACP methyl ester carboxylesterase
VVYHCQPKQAVQSLEFYAYISYMKRYTLQNLQLHKMESWPLLQNKPPAMENIASIKVPVLIIYGDKDLPYITEASSYLADHIPGAKHVVMKGVAHMLNIEKPAELNQLLLDFFK